MFFLAHDPDDNRDAPLWVVWKPDDRRRTYVWLPKARRFVEHLYDDFFFDQDLDYEEITPEQAAEAIQAGQIGRLDLRRRLARATYQRLLDRPTATLTDAFGAGNEPWSNTERARAIAADLKQNSSAGYWRTWRTYPPDRAQLAHVAAHDLRAGRVKALAELGLQARVHQHITGELEVQVRPESPVK